MPVIEVDHLTKEYKLGALQSFKQTILNAGARLTGKQTPERPLFKALDDVNFKIEQGEVVGIIGHNGAGKSTLLKMLARISTPTHGTVKVNGRIAPLIEVGAGFVPDFTGRENIYLNGAILGMSNKELRRKLDEIVAFAEMENFIDTPVKRYSSGMQVKLAFSVATSMECEILIVDEVLAVGDLAFQRKCFDRMEHMIKRQGKTVLLVSHNVRQVERLCSRVILLDKGRIAEDGSPPLVCNRFTDIMNVSIHASRTERMTKEIQNSGEVQDVKVEILDSNNSQSSSMKFGERGHVRFYFTITSELHGVALYVGIHTSDFVYLTNNNTAYAVHDFTVGAHVVDLVFEKIFLIPGTYSLLLWVGTPQGKVSYHTENLASFTVSSDDFSITRQQGQAMFSMPATWYFDGENP